MSGAIPDSIYDVYETALQYASNAAEHGITWIRTGYDYAYPKLAEISAIVASYISTAAYASATFLWNYSVWIIGGAAITAVLVTLYYHWKNSREYPIATLKSSLNRANLHVEIPHKAKKPINATLTFCIDMSQSMDTNDRGGAVKKAVIDVLNNAQKAIDSSPDTSISIAIVGFNQQANVITSTAQLTKHSHVAVESIMKQVEKVQFVGQTSIQNGLDKTIEELKRGALTNSGSSHTVILLTDGEDKITSQNNLAIQNSFTSSGATLYAIGIGKDHNKGVLKRLVDNSNDTAFKGCYFDTSTGQDTIASAVSQIYQQAISSFNNLVLSCSQLPPDSWSVIGNPSQQLGALAEGKTLDKVIKIHRKRLKEPVDLSKVVFDLSFTDPNGRIATLSLPWNGNTIVDPAIGQ